MNILTTASIRAGYVMMLNLIAKSVKGWLGRDPFASETERLNYPDPPKNPYTAGSNDILKDMAVRIEKTINGRIAEYSVAHPRGSIIWCGPQERAVVVPKDVWAELQAMPNDGSWSTRQLVRAIQRANKKKRGAP